MLSADNDLSGRQKRFHAYKVFVFWQRLLGDQRNDFVVWWMEQRVLFHYFSVCSSPLFHAFYPYILLSSFFCLESSFPGSVPVIIYACHYASKQVRRGVIVIQKHLILTCCTCGLIRLDKSHFGLSPDHTIEEQQVHYWCMI
jgi:hypothetical protein